jgi:hypothetical protein
MNVIIRELGDAKKNAVDTTKQKASGYEASAIPKRITAAY